MAEMPCAKVSGRVAGVLQRFGQRAILGADFRMIAELKRLRDYGALALIRKATLLPDKPTAGVEVLVRARGIGPLDQGRFQSLPIEEDDHLPTVCRYFERNSLRANLVSLAQEWRWSSLWPRGNRSRDVTFAKWPAPRVRKWIDFANEPETEAELKSLRHIGDARDTIGHDRLAAADGESTWTRFVVTCLPGRLRKTVSVAGS